MIEILSFLVTLSACFYIQDKIDQRKENKRRIAMNKAICEWAKYLKEHPEESPIMKRSFTSISGKIRGIEKYYNPVTC